MAKAVAILAGVPGASDALEFAGGRVMAVGVEIDEDCPLIGRPVTDLRRHDAGRPARRRGVPRGARAGPVRRHQVHAGRHRLPGRWPGRACAEP